MEAHEGALLYRCFLCGSVFAAPQNADQCCARAKAQVLCEKLRENYGGNDLEAHCNTIKARLAGPGHH